MQNKNYYLLNKIIYPLYRIYPLYHIYPLYSQIQP